MERSKNILDKLGSIIPGYRGYADRDSRRSTDKLLRERICSSLLLIQAEINERIEQLIEDKKLQELEKLDQLRQEISTTHSRIKFAPYGNSSFFSDNQIKDEELQKIYDYDSEIFTIIEESIKEINTLQQNDFKLLLKTVNSKVNIRNNYIKEHK